MASADGSVVIGVNMNVNDAEKELQSLKKEIFSLEKDTELKSFLAESLVKQTREAEKNLNAAKKTLEGMKDSYVSPSDYESRKEDIEKQETIVKTLQKEFDSLEKEANKYGDQIDQNNLKLDFAKQRYAEITAEAEKLRAEEEARRAEAERQETINAGLTEESPETSILGNIKGRISEALDNFAELMKTNLGNAARAGVKAFGDGLKSLPGKMKSIFSKGIKFVSSLGSGIMNAAQKFNVFGGMLNGIGSALSRVGRMIRRVFVFSVITSGLRAARTAISEYLGQNQQLMSALGQLKGVLLTAFQPILDVIVPALTTLVNFLTKAAAAVAQFIAALFGTTAKKAQASAAKATGGLSDEAGALDDVSEAAEEAEGSLASFDEINTIATESKSADTGKGGTGSGGGGGADLGAATFDYDFDDTVFDSWGEAFSAFLDDIISGIARLKEAFGVFAGWFNDFNTKLLEMFTFPGVKEKVVQIGQDLANALNYLVGSIDWNTFGAALGAGFNLGLLALVNLIYTFDWLALGKSLANAINSFISQVDWYAFGQLLMAKFKISLETLAGFLLNLDMAQLAAAISQIITGMFDSMTETIASIDWKKLGEQLKEFLVNLDWDGIAKSVFTAIGAAFGALTEFLWGLLKDAWQSVVNWWHDNAEDEDGNFIIDGLWEGIKKAVSGAYDWIKENIFKPFMEGFKKVFGINSPSTVMSEQGGYIIDGLYNGIKKGLQPIIDMFTNLRRDIEQVFNGIIDFIAGVFTGDWDRAWSGVTDIFRGIWNGIIDLLEGAVNLIINGINGMISMLNRLQIQMPDWLGGGVLGFNIPTFGTVSIPRLAEGAVIPPNREFMAVLGDQKSGTNVEAPLDTIKQALVEALRENGGSGGGDIHITLELDGAVVARKTVKHINDMTRQAGKPVLLY